MKLAVLSGKGGTGKTFVSVNLAVTAGQATYIDCDVEEPNGRLFLKPEGLCTEEVSTLLPDFNPEKCVGCRKCVDFCRFHALVFLKNLPKVFSEVCHSCGGCRLVCPKNAVKEIKRPVGHVEEGHRQDVHVLTGVLNPGESSGVPVISAALRKGFRDDHFIVIDCPPGSGCPVVESVSKADFCIIVTEPTAFGFHNFKMVQELTALLKKPCAVVINKADQPYEPLETFCAEREIPILARIPYSQRLAALGADGQVAVEQDPETAALFRELYEQIGGENV